MNSSEIEHYNRKSLTECDALVDLRAFPREISGQQLRQSLAKVSARPQNKCYRKGEEVDEEFYQALERQLNLEQTKKTIPVRFGITVKRTEMRAFPTYDRVFAEPDDSENDLFIATALYPAEPLAILHHSLDGEWLFAQGYNYRAWLPAIDVAVADRHELFSYLDTPNFLVVTGKSAATSHDPLHPEISELQLDMGTRIPLSLDKQPPTGHYVVKLPARSDRGQLEFRLGLLARSEDVRIGYLPLTRANIIQQAFKFLGQRYGWGGMFNTRDCSAFILDIYRSMGVVLPRNSGEQGRLAIGISHNFAADMTLEQRQATFDRLPAATPIYMTGHAMIYLGRYQNDYYIIHDVAGFLLPDANGKLVTLPARCVFVTSLLNTYLSSGKKYLEGIYAAREFMLP